MIHGEQLIEYEPERFIKPIDFVISNSNGVINIQMKNLSNSERENRRNKVIDEIKRSLPRFRVSKFLCLSLHEDFNENDVEALLNQLDQNLASNNLYNSKIQRDGIVIAHFSLHDPNSSKFEHLVVGTISDLNMINITGEDPDQIFRSLCKADRSFLHETNDENIDLVVMESDNHSDIDIAEALYGEEIFQFHQDGNRSWCRGNKGYYCNESKQNLISGVIAIRRIDRSPVSMYNNTLFINPKFEPHLVKINKIIEFERLIRCCDLPTR